MSPSFLANVPAWLVAMGIFILMITFNWLGYRYRKVQIRKHAEDVDPPGPMEVSLLGLMGLMLAFSFSMASSKFENRRVIIVDEANNIATAMRNSFLYPDSVRNLFLVDFKQYLEARISYYDAVNDPGLISAALEKSNYYSMRILRLAIQQSKNPQNNIRTGQMIPAVNGMIESVTIREASRIAKTPSLIFIMLLLLIFSTTFLVGYGNKAKKINFIMVTGFALITTLTVYVIIELDRPRRGVINLDEAEKNIIELRNQVNQNTLEAE